MGLGTGFSLLIQLRALSTLNIDPDRKDLENNP